MKNSTLNFRWIGLCTISFLLLMGFAINSFTQTLYSVSSGDANLRTINTATAATLTSTPMTIAGGTVNSANGLATDNSGQLWVLLQASGLGLSGRALCTLNPATGVCTLIGDTGDFFAGIAFDCNGTLYGVTGDGASTPEALFTLSTADGSATFVCSLGNGTGGEAIGFNPSDSKLYHASGHTGSGVIFELINDLAMDPCGVTNINISGTALENEEAQALTWWDAEGVFLWKQQHSSGPLFKVTTAGVPTLIGNLDHQSKGLAFGGITPCAPPPVISQNDYDGDGTPDVSDPCSCGDPQNCVDGSGMVTLFHDFITVVSNPGETWEISALNSGGIFEGDCSTAIVPSSPNAQLTDLGGGVYRIDLWHPAGTGFDVDVTRTLGGAFTANVSNSCMACQQIPTLGQWGLIILSLLILTFGVVALRSRQAVLAGAGGGSNFPVRFRQLPFNGAAYRRMLAFVMIGIVAVFAGAVLVFGYEMTMADVPGSLVAGPLLAYLLHLFVKNEE